MMVVAGLLEQGAETYDGFELAIRVASDEVGDEVVRRSLVALSGKNKDSPVAKITMR
jgi:hypothetical protein